MTPGARRITAVPPRVPARTLIVWLALAAAFALLPRGAAAQPAAATEFEVKAGYLVRFAQYTTWPQSALPAAGSPIVIGVLDADEVLRQLEVEVRGLAGGRPVEVRRLTSVDDAARCHVVYFGATRSGREAAWLRALRGKPILTVGESDLAIRDGAVMRFVMTGKNVRFEASLAAAAANQLELHEKMLGVATRVYRRQAQQGAGQ